MSKISEYLVSAVDNRSDDSGRFIEVEAKFHLELKPGLPEKLVDIGFSRRFDRPEIDLFFLPKKGKSLTEIVKVRLSSQLYRPTLIAKTKIEVREVEKISACVSDVVWKKLSLNSDVVTIMNNYKYELKDVIQKRRVLYTKGNLAVTVDDLGEVGQYLEIGDSAINQEEHLEKTNVQQQLENISRVRETLNGYCGLSIPEISYREFVVSKREKIQFEGVWGV